MPQVDVSRARGQLFGQDPPDGFRYRRDFLTSDDEASFAEEIARVEFSNYEMRGVVARRRVAFFGRSYDRRVELRYSITFRTLRT